jgi:hypothetical protein
MFEQQQKATSVDSSEQAAVRPQVWAAKMVVLQQQQHFSGNAACLYSSAVLLCTTATLDTLSTAKLN